MRILLALIFFLSGASALIFESLWFRLAGLSLGNSVWSASLVLAAFMGGLALGNVLVARLHRRIRRPVRLYAALELAIGTCGLLVVLLLPGLPGLLGPILGGMTDTPVFLNFVRLTIAFAFLVVPATAMGATLPVLAQALSRRDKNFGATIGWLYGWNTLGAMAGVFSAELALVPAFGIMVSGLIALACNLLAAIIALGYSKPYDAKPPAEAPAPEMGEELDTRGRRFVAVAFLSGALMLALEVVWFRFLLLTLDGTSLVFAVMLAVVLAGIAIGGLVAGQWFRRDEEAYRWLRLVSAVSAAFVVLTYRGYDLFAVYSASDEPTTLEFVGYAAFLMFPVAMLSGIAFTMVNRAVKRYFGSSARTAGIVTCYNTVGAMLGSLAGGFILLPIIGMELSFFLIATMYLVVAIVVPLRQPREEQTVRWNRAAVAAALTSLVLFPFGLMKKTHFSAELAWLPGHTLIDTREGLVETIRYYQRNVYGEPKYYRLVTNGHSMSATSTASKRYMKLYVYLPLAVHPDVEDALLISYGVGQTAKALTDTRRLQTIDVVDISEDILEMSSIVYPGDDNPLLDERVRVHVEDGRFFLNTTGNRYDLITSEPPPPKMAGVVNLYSQEYFELIHARLNPGGYATYWLPVEQLEPVEALAITRAFCNAFDDCSLWAAAGLEWMLMGSNGARRQADADRFSEQWQDPLVARELVALGLETPAQLGSLFMADAPFLDELTADVDPVIDNFPSRISPQMSGQGDYVELYARLLDESSRLERFRNSEQIDKVFPSEMRKAGEIYFPYERLIRNHFTGGIYREPADPYFWQSIDDVLTNTSLTTLPLWLLGSDWLTQDIVARVTQEQGIRDEFALDIARKHAAERDFENALRFVSLYVEKTGEASDWTSRFYLYLLAKNGLQERALPAIPEIRRMGWPGMDRFLDWYLTTFDLHDASGQPRSAPGAQSLSDAALR